MIVLVGSHNAQQVWCRRESNGKDLDYLVNTKQVISISHVKHLDRLEKVDRRKDISLNEVGVGMQDLKHAVREVIARKPL